MTAPAPDFDAARETYEAAHGRLLGLIDEPDKTVPVSEYRAMLKDAQKDAQRARNEYIRAWGERNRVKPEDLDIPTPGNVTIRPAP